LFDQPATLPMRAAIASLLGSLFGIALILATHTSLAQAHEPAAAASSIDTAPSIAMITRIGDAALRSLRGGPEPLLAAGPSGSRGLQLSDSAIVPGSGLRWQVARIPTLRSEGDIPRARDLISLGMQIRF